MGLLSPFLWHPGLKAPEIGPLSRRYIEKVWQSYLEKLTPSAARIYLVNGPGKSELKVIGLEPHAEDKKNSGYAKVKFFAAGRELVETANLPI